MCGVVTAGEEVDAAWLRGESGCDPHQQGGSQWRSIAGCMAHNLGPFVEDCARMNLLFLLID